MIISSEIFNEVKNFKFEKFPTTKIEKLKFLYFLQFSFFEFLSKQTFRLFQQMVKITLNYNNNT